MPCLHSHPAYTPAPPYNVILHGDLIFENDNCIVKVRRGFVSDGGSIPRIFWSLLGVTPYDPRCVYAFILHDYLYRSESVPRLVADRILLEVLQIEPRCRLLQRLAIWAAVRLAGWLAWLDHNPLSVIEAHGQGQVKYKNL